VLIVAPASISRFNLVVIASLWSSLPIETEQLSLQRHLSMLNKFAHVESQVCGRKQRG
jgi:hypothetical protein